MNGNKQKGIRLAFNTACYIITNSNISNMLCIAMKLISNNANSKTTNIIVTIQELHKL